MAESLNKLDLELWLDQEFIPRQNSLKAKFWEILAEVGNAMDTEVLLEIHSASRGIKLTKGNDLLGYPYQVLDLIRDFDSADGLNFRLLNWFGHGLFLFVLLGKNHPKGPLQQLREESWQFDTSPTPWDYPEILLNHACTNSPTTDQYDKSTFYQWHKRIEISGETLDIKADIVGELNKLTLLLS